MPREEFKADDGTTVILTDTFTVASHYDNYTMEYKAAIYDKPTSCGFNVSLDDHGCVRDVGMLGQSDAKVRLMIELPPDTEDSDGDS